MADAMKKEIDNSWTEAKSQAIAKIEKEKGRKMTDEEKAEFNKKEPEARKKMNEIMNGMRIGITVEFKSDKQAVMKLDMKMNDEVMKQAGIGWVKRKAMQAAMAVLPSSEKVEYVVKTIWSSSTPTMNPTHFAFPMTASSSLASLKKRQTSS